MAETVLITGASSGIGEAMVRLLAERGFDLVLVARSKDKLEALAAELGAAHKINAVAMAQDLSDPNAADDLLARCDEADLTIDFLINNAGFAHLDSFMASPVDVLLDLVQVNIAAVVHLARLFGARMAERGRGRILNVASIAAFQPIPSLGAYAASKAFVLSLTEALAVELKDKGVTVTALCPGFTNTPLAQRATDRGFDALPIPGFLLSNPDDVAREGIDGALAGKVIVIPGVANQLAIGVTKFQPRFLVRTIGGMAVKLFNRSLERSA